MPAINEDWTKDELKSFAKSSKFLFQKMSSNLPFSVPIHKKFYYPNQKMIYAMIEKDLGQHGPGYKYATDSDEYLWDLWMGVKGQNENMFYIMFSDIEYAKQFKRRLLWTKIVMRIKNWRQCLSTKS